MCHADVEDFLLVCPLYYEWRTKLIPSYCRINPSMMNTKNSELINMVAKFAHKAFKIRTNIFTQPWVWEIKKHQWYVKQWKLSGPDHMTCSCMYVKPNQNYYGGAGIYWRNDIQNLTQIDLNFKYTCYCIRWKVEIWRWILLIGGYNKVSVKYPDILLVM